MMIRLIKSDFYRLMKSKGIWIIFIFAISFAILNVLLESVGSVGSVDASILESAKWSLTGALNNSFISSAVLLFLAPTFLVVIVSSEFSQNTLKNTLTDGISRTTFVLAKSCLVAFGLFSLYVIYELATFITAYFKYVIDSSFNRTFIENFSFGLVNNWLCLLAIAMLAAFLMYLTSNNILSAVFLVLCPIIFQIVLVVLHNDVVTKYLKYFDYLSLVQMTGYGMLSRHDLWQFTLTNLIIIIVVVIGSIAVFRKKEL